MTRILIVDDNPTNLKLVTFLVKAMASSSRGD
jgi:CheY-like chemotaxis protein